MRNRTCPRKIGGRLHFLSIFHNNLGQVAREGGLRRRRCGGSGAAIWGLKGG
jgi:hypothetical protein